MKTSRNKINEGDGTENQVLETMASEVPSAGHASTTWVAPNIVVEEEAAADTPLVSKRRRKRVNDRANANAPPKVLRKDFDVSRPTQSTFGGKSLTVMGLKAGSTLSAPASQETPTGTIDPDPLSFAKPPPAPERDIAQSSKGVAAAGVPESKYTTPSMVGSPGSIYQHGYGYGLSRRSNFKEIYSSSSPAGPKDSGQAMKSEKKNLEVLLEVEAHMKKAAEARNAELVKELESLRTQFTDLQVSHDGLSHQVSTLQAQVTGEEKIKAAFEEFKKYEKIKAAFADMDAHLDALSIDFNEELYPHMLTAIAEWVMGTDLKDDDKYVAALHVLKDLKYPLIDQLEKLRDALLDLILASLHLESDTGEDVPQWICELRPSSSQLKIPVYPEVRDPKDPWAYKEEILLEDAIAPNVSRAEKKKKCRVVCRTHGVGSAHHARSDGVPISVPIMVPQGLAILLVDAATQTEVPEDEPSPKLIRSKSLPPVYNLDWP
ncbi:hypothetical protein Tco_0729816 [Tanacetum coccineum]|uniref:Uncharacterized protein n=1 Tax=Tanacetum coccineum TaxID=301880 RepID=A0ABQ4YQF7_9ASTR